MCNKSLKKSKTDIALEAHDYAGLDLSICYVVDRLNIKTEINRETDSYQKKPFTEGNSLFLE